MKKVLAMLLLALLLTAGAAGAEGNRLLEVGSDEYMRGLLAVGDELVAVYGDGLYTWREGEDAFTWREADLRLENPYQKDGEAAGLYEIAFFDDGGTLRGLRLLRDESGVFRGMQLFDAAFTEAGTVVAENAVELPLPGEIGDMEWFDIRQVVCREGVLYALGEGEEVTLCVIDPERPRDAAVERLQSWDNALAALPDGVLLATGANEEDGRLGLYRLGADGSREALCRVEAEAASIAADPVGGAVYAAMNGRVCPVDLQTGELGEAVAALPLGGDRAAVPAGGRFYAAAMEGGGVAVLDTRGRLDESAVLYISSGRGDEWIDRAVMRFAVEHHEVTPVLGYDSQNVLEAMMTQSANTDVYIMDLLYSTDYPALLERGYMLPLDGSEALAGLYGRFYPGVRSCVGRDGVPMALPVAVRGESMSVSEPLLEKLGLSLADVPEDWPGFLDFLEGDIRPRLDRLGENASFTYDDMTAGGFRFFLFQSILRDWVQANRAAGRVANYEDPRLARTLQKLDGMDFSAFGLREDEVEDGFGFDYGFGWSDSMAYLIQINNDFTPDNSFGTDGAPIALGFGGDLPGVYTLQLSCAFVNPYSERADAAVAFLEALAGDLPAGVEYALCPDLNEPLKRDDWERIEAQFQQSVANVEAELENARPAEKQALEETLEGMKREYDASLERTLWVIPEGRLERYRAIGDRLAVALPSWFDGNGEAWELMKQYMARMISAGEFLQAVNQKARMMEMEG